MLAPCTSRSPTSPATTIAIWPGQLASEPPLFTLRQHTRASCTNSECLKENLYIVHRKANHPDVKIARSLDPRLIFRTCQVPPGVHVGDEVILPQDGRSDDAKPSQAQAIPSPSPSHQSRSPSQAQAARHPKPNPKPRPKPSHMCTLLRPQHFFLFPTTTNINQGPHMLGSNGGNHRRCRFRF